MKICKNCGEEVTGKFCMKCGTPAPEDETPVANQTANTVGKFCKKCGKPVDGKFCMSCGTPVDESTATPNAAVTPSAGVAPTPTTPPMPGAAPQKKMEQYTLFGILGLGAVLLYMLMSGLSTIIQNAMNFFGPGINQFALSFFGFVCMAVLIAGTVLSVVGLVQAVRNKNVSPEVKQRDKIFGIISTVVSGGTTAIVIVSAIITAIITAVALI